MGLERTLSVDQLNQRLDVAEGEREGLLAAVISVDFRDMIRHQHPVVADFLVGSNGADHVHVAIVGKSLAKVEKAAFNIAEMDIEDLFPLAEIADDVVNFLVRILEHL